MGEGGNHHGLFALLKANVPMFLGACYEKTVRTHKPPFFHFGQSFTGLVLVTISFENVPIR